MFIVVSDKINEEILANKKIIFLESPCNIKNITDENNYLIIDKNISIKEDGFFTVKDNENSLINQISIDELLIMVNIKLIILKEINQKIVEISNYYNIDYLILK